MVKTFKGFGYATTLPTKWFSYISFKKVSLDTYNIHYYLFEVNPKKNHLVHDEIA